MKSFINNKMNSGLVVLLLSLAVSTTTIYCGEVVTSLPGYGDLNFTLETGYVGVGENEDVQLFYLFVESEGNPSEDPLMLWVTDGPGCSTLSGLLLENGPLTIDVEGYNGGIPKLFPSQYSWTQNMSVLYLDGPSGTVYSYSKTNGTYYSSDAKFSVETFEFIQKWFEEYPQYLENPFYIGGNGGNGKVLPLVVEYILKGNLSLNLKGLVLGNPITDNNIDFNVHVELYHRLALIPDYLYHSANEHCQGNFLTNLSAACSVDLDAINKLVQYIPSSNELKPSCNADTPLSTRVNNGARRCLQEKTKLSSILEADTLKRDCDDFTHLVIANWANNTEVQEALHVREGTAAPWECNQDTYSKVVTSVLDSYKYMVTTDLQTLIYSGDHDLSISYIGTLQWIGNLSLTTDEYWRAWFVDQEVAGYTIRYTESYNYNLTFATVKGAGHFAPADKGSECAAMVKRWIANISL